MALYPACWRPSPALLPSVPRESGFPEPMRPEEPAVSQKPAQMPTLWLMVPALSHPKPHTGPQPGLHSSRDRKGLERGPSRTSAWCLGFPPGTRDHQAWDQ